MLHMKRKKNLHVYRRLVYLCIGWALLGAGIMGCAQDIDVLNKYGCNIINVDEVYNQRKSINVRIPRKLNKQELTEIAKYLKKKNAQYSYLFILYYLPEMQVGNGAFATSHFNPNLNVDFGATSEFIECSPSLILTSQNGIKVIGTWYDNSLGTQTVYQIYQKSNKYILRKIIGNGFTENKMHYTNKNGSKKFTYDSDDIEYFIIDSRGNLGIYDELGFIMSCPQKNY